MTSSSKVVREDLEEARVLGCRTVFRSPSVAVFNEVEGENEPGGTASSKSPSSMTATTCHRPRGCAPQPTYTHAISARYISPSVYTVSYSRNPFPTLVHWSETGVRHYNRASLIGQVALSGW